MRYPVGDGTKESFDRDWYVAQAFGATQPYGYHEAVDINKRTGGDSDLGQPVYAIADGRIANWHFDEHPNINGFGRHLIYEIPGPWGKRYVHCAHLDAADFGGGSLGQSVFEGQLIGRIGKSGNQTWSHLHFAILTVAPTNIENVANSWAELNANWEDPLPFIDKWLAVIPCPITDMTLIPQIGNKSVAAIREELVGLRAKVATIRSIVV